MDPCSFDVVGGKASYKLHRQVKEAYPRYVSSGVKTACHFAYHAKHFRKICSGCFLSDLKQLISLSGIEAKKNVVVTQADQIGPLPSTLIKSVDWLLVFSLFFLISFIMYATIRTESIRWLIPGQEQEHVE